MNKLIAQVALAVALVAGAAANAQGINYCLDIATGHLHHFRSALDRADANDCPAYQEAISSENKAIEQLRACLPGANPGRQTDLVRKGIESAQRALKLAQTAANQDGCTSSQTAEPPPQPVADAHRSVGEKGTALQKLTTESLMGRWCSDTLVYSFTPQKLTVTFLDGRPQRILRIKDIEIRDNRIEVSWDLDTRRHDTAFIDFAPNSMAQEPNIGGDKGPRRDFHRC